MSVDKEPMDPKIATVLEIWNAALHEARATNDDALSAACMMLGTVCMAEMETKELALQNFSDVIYDIYKFIDVNYETVRQQQAKRRKLGG